MNVNLKIKGDLEVKDDFNSYLDEKIESIKKYLKNYNEDEVFIEVELQEGEVEKHRRFRVDLTVNVPGERTHAVGWGETLNAALDEAKDELSRRLRREKKKKLSLLKKAGRKFKEMLRGF